MPSTASRQSIRKLHAQIEELTNKLDPNANRTARIVVDEELTKALPREWQKAVHHLHCRLFPEDAGAKRVLFVVTSVRRCESRCKQDRASFELMRMIDHLHNSPKGLPSPLPN